MRHTIRGPRPVARQATLGGLAIAALVRPDGAYSVVAANPAEVLIVRLLLLVGVSLLAVIPWLSEADDDVRRRLRRWTIPGVGASAVYFVSAETLYLIVGFCLLVGATLDVWATRAHIASESLRTRLLPGDRDRPT
jgi:Sec-independent protein secretion pathway component TatC